MPKNKKKPGHKQTVPKPEVADDVIVETSDETVEDERKFAKRKIFKNWAKYEQNIDTDSVNQVEEDRDFKFLEKSSDSTNFFQLAEEKEWEKSRLNPENSLFSLDVKLLSAGIACLPLYEIFDVDQNLLSHESIENCDKLAKNNVLRYRREYPVLEESQAKKKPIVQEVVEKESAIVVESETQGEDAELEDWLDSVLDN